MSSVVFIGVGYMGYGMAKNLLKKHNVYIFAHKNRKPVNKLIKIGASPRASINLILAAKAKAFIERRGYVIPEDVRYIGKDVLCHRLSLTYEAEAEELLEEDIVQRLFETIEIP